MLGRAVLRTVAGAQVLRTGAAAGAVTAAAMLVSGCARAAAEPPPPVSWNKHVKERPVRATISEILGTTINTMDGATRAGGWHGGKSLADHRRWAGKKLVSGVDQKRLVPPPAEVAGVPVLVEVDNAEIVAMYDNGHVPGTDHDTSANACMVGRPRSNLTCIHIGIDGRWKARGWAPPDFPMHIPIDIQGYIYWDDPHPSEGVPLNSAPSHYVQGHYETGWEIHPVSAWRLHRQ